ncbi:epoxide hydrolase family protein [Nakamurella leprariae]|uniref:Epoxide hydrolase n=1 Tax=Nakamurella leprariae TaxID=2803911 RepID=A0A938YGE9_9ACTN|nr:epoxide hydrolase family protein [Nakamurella leprariae]MBM9467902.1 epoxide hydrolase [Nakamurella leprariae]
MTDALPAPTGTEIAPFTVEHPEADLDDLQDRLVRTRWPGQLPGAGWDYGVEQDSLVDLVEHWRTGFDWRAQERRLNARPQFVTAIDGQRVHFLHVPSARPDAIPLLITHGWPSTVTDFLPILDALTDPPADRPAFSVVAPSVPGFAWSGPTTERGWSTGRIARAWIELMGRLGYDRFGVQGGDFGALVSPEISRMAPDRVIGVHVNALADAATVTDPSELDLLGEADRAKAQENESWWYGHSGYATQMSTRPQTLAYALNDSPAGQLAWNLEWLVDWDPTTSRQTPVDRDAILTDVTALWLTGTAGSAARLYLEAGADAWGVRPAPSGVPTAVLTLTGDRAVRGLAERSHHVVRWTELDTGGHFASLQAPDALVDDVRAFFASLRT